MMRLNLIFILILITLGSYAQGNSGNLYELTIACELKKVGRENSVILALANRSDTVIHFPKDAIALSKRSGSANAVIMYEVEYCGLKDTVDVTYLARQNVNAIPFGKAKKIEIWPGDTHYFAIEPGMPNIFFTEKGTYRLRFMLNEKLAWTAPYIGGVKTPWFIIRVN